MKLNPLAVIIWLMMAGVGYLWFGVRGAISLAVFGMGLSLIASIADLYIAEKKRRG